MKISIVINYHTDWGETLHVCGAIPALGNGDEHKAVEMDLVSPDTWMLTLELDKEPEAFDYHFIVKAPERAWKFEWGEPHHFEPGKGIRDYALFDAWHDMPGDKPFYSSAFIDGMLHREHRDAPIEALPDTVCFKLMAPMVAPDEVVAIAGEGEALGNWDAAKAIRMNDARYPLWEVNVPMAGLKVPFEYKFVIIKKDSGEVVGWENTSNRIYGIHTGAQGRRVVIESGRLANPKPNWKGAGTAIPVFSIRTEDDFGVGDFVDIKKMVDWCAETGQKILQVLPVNDTIMTRTWVDSYPYKANSTFALHPMYVRLEEVGTLQNPDRREYFKHRAQELNALEEIDYEAVNNGKEEYLHEIYVQDGAETLISDEFKKFLEKNEYWLKPYAAWSVLRDRYNTPDNNLWEDMAKYDDKKVDAFVKENAEEIGFYYFVQFHLDRQLRGVRDYAHSKGVVLKGDIPIGISRFSVDAWKEPELFNMNTQAGAPPDDFSIMGQNWGFPTYNWDAMASDGFQWWKNRFRKMAEYFDAYRIDHILGFFRIWEIPMDAVHGLLGYFNPALPFSPEEMRHNYDFWINTDIQTKPLILEWMLDEMLGDRKEIFKERFLDHVGGDRYKLKEYVDTQRKVEELFATYEKNEENSMYEDILMSIIDNVLFIEDPYKPGHYHPRISAQFSYQFRMLNDYERWCFNRLYNDFYYHRHNDFWYGKAMWKLPPLLDSTWMLTCAEDLGMIPDCVPAVMSQLEILTLEIERMPKNPALEFGDTWNYPYYSVCTTSTHDMAGIRAWWESDRAMANRFYRHILGEHGEAPFYAEPWICDKILDLQLKSPSMLCILPLQDWMSADGSLRRENPNDEQINVPANPKHYWRYRMHLPVEQLLKEDAFNSAMRSKIYGSGR